MSDKQPKKKRARRTKAECEADEYYVHSGVFKEKLQIYYDTDEIPEVLGEYIINIANGLGRKPNFSGYSYIDEMKDDAIVMMNKAIINKSYKFALKTNPFSYFTAIAYNAFVSRINYEKRAQKTLEEYKELTYEALLCTGEFESNGVHIYSRPNTCDDD